MKINICNILLNIKRTYINSKNFYKWLNNSIQNSKLKLDSLICPYCLEKYLKQKLLVNDSNLLECPRCYTNYQLITSKNISTLYIRSFKGNGIYGLDKKLPYIGSKNINIMVRNGKDFYIISDFNELRNLKDFNKFPKNKYTIE